MKKILSLCVLGGVVSFAPIIGAQTVINTAGSGSGAFAVNVEAPFGSASFVNASASFASTNLGWRNNGSDGAFAQMIQFTVTGNEAALNDLGNTVTLTLDSITALGGSSSLSVWFASSSAVDARSQGDGGANGLLATAALPTTGLLIGSVSSTGQHVFDVTSMVQSLDFSTNKQLYFRVQVAGPTSNPGSSPLGFASLDGSTLSIAAIPEPSAAGALLGLGALAMVMLRRRR